jgi:biopolymer transport protein ExbD
MAMSIPGLGDSDEEFELNSTINTTPLVDVMLVLLIIFLVTVPVVVGVIQVELPREENIVTQTKPENVNIAVDADGDIYWGQTLLADEEELFMRLAERAVEVPQPEVHVRGDASTRYENVGAVVRAAQRAGIQKVGFITSPPARSVFDE